MKECSETKISAIVGSCSAEAIDDIKAVTYSEMEIKKSKQGWEATIVFDI
jgi:SHS2 domain-containing protein